MSNNNKLIFFLVLDNKFDFFQERRGNKNKNLNEDSLFNGRIPFGYYRVDIQGVAQHREIVAYTRERNPIWGYVPIVPHKGIMSNYPVVLTDGTRVVFERANNISSTIRDWCNGEFDFGEKRTLLYYDRWGNECKKVWWLVTNNFRGVRATRFLDMRDAKKEAKKVYRKERNRRKLSTFEKKLHLIELKNVTFHRHVDGWFDQYWPCNNPPRELIGHIVEGWYNMGNGFYIRRPNPALVELFVETEWASVNMGKYVIKGFTPKFVSSVVAVDIFNFLFFGKEWWEEYLHANILSKVRDRRDSGIDIKKILEKNQDKTLRIEVSSGIGNAQERTTDFIRYFDIVPDDKGCVTISSLLENKKIEKMVKNPNLQEMVLAQLINHQSSR